MSLASAEQQTLAAPTEGTTASSPVTQAAELTSATKVHWLPVLYVASLALLLASFPARNNDLWQHLTEGRDLFQLPVAEQVGHQSLLFDVLVYAAYAVVGGPFLVF